MSRTLETQTIGSHQITYDAVFQHPIARNLQWRDVRAMLASLADMKEEQNGNLKFSKNGHAVTVHPPRRKDFSDIQELMQIRHFLEQIAEAPAPAIAHGAQFLVVIDHREARIFKTELHGAVPHRIVPLDPGGAHRHLHNVDNNSNGQRKPELKLFYESIARALQGAEKILILGSATGASSAMEYLVTELKAHHADLAKRIVGTIVVNEQHMSEDQLLAKAREVYAGLEARPAAAGEPVRSA
jgi:hypothetical protein